MVVLVDNSDYGLADTDEAVVYENRMQYLNEALDALAPEEVNLLRLKYEDGLDVDTIARQYELSNSAVKMRLKRSRDKVRLHCVQHQALAAG